MTEMAITATSDRTTMNTNDAEQGRASLSVLINQIDHISSPPGPLDNTSLHRVPVIRIYGASSAGDKACVHVHQVYPYFFVEYAGNMTPDHGKPLRLPATVDSPARQSTVTLPSCPYPSITLLHSRSNAILPPPPPSLSVPSSL